MMPVFSRNSAVIRLSGMLLFATAMQAALRVPAGAAADVLYLYGSAPPAGASYQLRLNDTGPTGLSQFKSAVQELGLSIEEKLDTTFTLTDAALKDYSVLIFGSNNRSFTAAEMAALRAFVAQSGAALVFSAGEFGFDEGRDSDNAVVQNFKMLMHHDNQAGTFTVSQYTQAHFITEGLTFKGHNVSMIRALGTPAIQLAACQGGACALNPVDGTIQANDSALVVASYLSGRVAATFDCSTFLNPPGDGTHIGEADNRQYAKNLLTWLMQHEPRTSAPAVTGELKKWHNVTLTFDGPSRNESAGTNPFLDYRMEVTFSKDGRQIKVPGYFAANGNAAETSHTHGNKWRVHFVPDEEGTWNYTASFRFGRAVAVSSSPGAGIPVSFDGVSGSFTVGPTDKVGRDLRGKGMLKYTGSRYLRFAERGEYFLKGGPGSPENFLGYLLFDNTYSTGGAYPDFIHQYLAHLQDYQVGDPVWQGSKGQGIIGALNYLSGKGMNTLYFLTYNIDGGDGMDVWPWTSPAVRDRYDCSKLDQWGIVFSHAGRVGIHLHVLTQETENDRVLDGGALGNIRKLYYRELVARFAHNLALTWNLGEENGNTDAQRKAFADYIRSLDPYDHPIVVHTALGQWDAVYNPLLGYPSFEGPSLQMVISNSFHAEVVKWVKRSAQYGRKWVVSHDEMGPANEGILPDHFDYWHDKARKRSLWGTLMGGGTGCEWYFGYDLNDNDLTCESFRHRDHMWDLTRYALDFFNNYVPFWRLEPADEYISTSEPVKYDSCLAKPGEFYVIFIRDGGTTSVNLTRAGTYTIRWYDPKYGGSLVSGTVAQITGPGWVGIGHAPYEPTSDWAAIVSLVPESAGSVSEARSRSDGSYVAIESQLVVTLVSRLEEGFFYAQNQDGSAGIRVQTAAALPRVGQKVTVTGTMSTRPGGERVIGDADYTISGTAAAKPRGLGSRSIDGPGFVQGVSDLDTQGLLMRAWGRVTYVHPSGSYFLLDDGANVDAQNVQLGLKVIDSGIAPSVGEFWAVTGVVTSEIVNGQKIRVLMGRRGAFPADTRRYSD